MSENTTPTKHTPGPWATNPLKAQVDAFDGPGGAPLPICQMLWPTELRGEAETFANAELIAAAPQMAARIAELQGLLEQVRADELAKIVGQLRAWANEVPYGAPNAALDRWAYLTIADRFEANGTKSAAEDSA